MCLLASYIPKFFFLGIIGLLILSCDSEPEFTNSAIKQRSIVHYPQLTDTNDIEVVFVSEETHSHWFISYNKVQTDVPRLCMYHSENHKEKVHLISLKSRPMASIENVYFEDVTLDGNYEMILELHYGYHYFYQGRELLIYHKPFSLEPILVFEQYIERHRERIDSFHHEYGIPIHTKTVEQHMTYEFADGMIILKGTIDFRKHHLKTYKWYRDPPSFVEDNDEDLQEVTDEVKKGGTTKKLTGSKKLMEVHAHEVSCRSFLVEDLEGHVILLEESIKHALECSRITALSKDGRFLVYTDAEKQTLNLHDFTTGYHKVLLDHLEMYEGISEVIWYKKKDHYRLIFIAVNPEEYLEKTCVWAFDLTENDAIQVKQFHQYIPFDCDNKEIDGWCAPVRGYHFGVDRYGNLQYRPYFHQEMEENRGDGQWTWRALKIDFSN